MIKYNVSLDTSCLASPLIHRKLYGYLACDARVNRDPSRRDKTRDDPLTANERRDSPEWGHSRGSSAIRTLSLPAMSVDLPILRGSTGPDGDSAANQRRELALQHP